ncbi:N-6 DNA methylase [Spirulina subsalsa]|uniref:N-6 DNA methylase n=1 Tax=Spirulina subsalsa TaxID=54311 RepID=UPI0002D6630B|nr:N-6 DNA methylase [Spirulina subsalsa]
MMNSNKKQLGDFQTPAPLADQILKLLKLKYQINPDFILEPTCGSGVFIQASRNEFSHAKIMGFDINSHYIQLAQKSIECNQNQDNIILKQADFFTNNWQEILSSVSGYLLILGNPPWATSSELSRLNSHNIPTKSNFQNRRGIEAITGSANFDISEWMLLQYIEWLSDRPGTIALLCKYSVARKVLQEISKKYPSSFSTSIYLIDAKYYFNLSVQACLFRLSTDYKETNDCPVYMDLKTQGLCSVIGERDGFMVRDTKTYEQGKHWLGYNSKYLWHSGIKHDCSKVMELDQIGGNLFVNGLGEKYYLETDYLYPLLKGSDVANGRVKDYRKLMLVPQRWVGEDTRIIQDKAPKTWQYLQDHDLFFTKRKSSIYRNKPPYAIFGVGDYSFMNWKIAISSLHKKLKFNLIGLLNNQPVMFDDTVNFLSFETAQEAESIFHYITSQDVLQWLESMIFWDSKRPITVNLLNRLYLEKFASVNNFSLCHK